MDVMQIAAAASQQGGNSVPAALVAVHKFVDTSQWVFSTSTSDGYVTPSFTKQGDTDLIVHLTVPATSYTHKDWHWGRVEIYPYMSTDGGTTWQALGQSGWTACAMRGRASTGIYSVSFLVRGLADTPVQFKLRARAGNYLAYVNGGYAVPPPSSEQYTSFVIEERDRTNTLTPITKVIHHARNNSHITTNSNAYIDLGAYSKFPNTALYIAVDAPMGYNASYGGWAIVAYELEYTVDGGTTWVSLGRTLPVGGYRHAHYTRISSKEFIPPFPETDYSLRLHVWNMGSGHSGRYCRVNPAIPQDATGAGVNVVIMEVE